MTDEAKSLKHITKNTELVVQERKYLLFFNFEVLLENVFYIHNY
jgi:hypothetical protein